MNITLLKILKQLNHLTYTHGTSIGHQLGLTRAAIWKSIQKLQKEYNIAIDSNRVQGYKLLEPLSLLDQQKISQGISANNVLIDCLPSVDSTNSYLQKSTAPGNYHICIAEQQLQGKGRFDRVWSSPFAENLYYSLKTNLTQEISELSGLSLAVAVCVANVLTKLFSGLEIKIKWPNDLYVNDQKLSGILIEVKAESNAQSQVVIGIGINVNMKKNALVSQPWTSLTCEIAKPIDRNELAICLTDELINALTLFEEDGFATFVERYHHYDYLRGKDISLSILNKEIVSGVANGVNDQGLLKLVVGSETKLFASGETSIIKR